MSCASRPAIVAVWVVAGLLADPTGGLSRGAFAADGQKTIVAVWAGQTPRAGTQLESRGRILGRIADCPGCRIDVLDGDREVVKSVSVEPGGDGYQVEWLDAATYTLRVTAKGYKTLHTVALLVKTRHDVQCNLRFVDEPPDGTPESDPSSDEARRKVKVLPTWSPKPAPKAPAPNFKPKGFGTLDKKFKNADPRNKRKVKGKGKGKGKAKQAQKRKGKNKGKKKTAGKKKKGKG